YSDMNSTKDSVLIQAMEINVATTLAFTTEFTRKRKLPAPFQLATNTEADGIMPPLTATLSLDNVEHQYKPGDTVSGRLILHGGNQEILHDRQVSPGSVDIQLQPGGGKTLAFRIQLTSDIPPSSRDSHWTITYYVTAYATRSGIFRRKRRKLREQRITMLPFLDLNSPQWSTMARESVKQTGCMHRGSDFVFVTVRVPKYGWAIGEQLTMSAVVFNTSSSETVREISCKLTRTTQIKVRGRTLTPITTNVVETIQRGAINPGRNDQFNIPPILLRQSLLPTGLLGCKQISVTCACVRMRRYKSRYRNIWNGRYGHVAQVTAIKEIDHVQDTDAVEVKAVDDKFPTLKMQIPILVGTVAVSISARTRRRPRRHTGSDTSERSGMAATARARREDSGIVSEHTVSSVRSSHVSSTSAATSAARSQARVQNQTPGVHQHQQVVSQSLPQSVNDSFGSLVLDPANPSATNTASSRTWPTTSCQSFEPNSLTQQPPSVPIHVGTPSMTPASVPVHVSTPSMTPASVPVHVSTPSMTPASAPLHVGTPSMTPASAPLHVTTPSMTTFSAPVHVGTPSMTPPSTHGSVSETSSVPLMSSLDQSSGEYLTRSLRQDPARYLTSDDQSAENIVQERGENLTLNSEEIQSPVVHAGVDTAAAQTPPQDEDQEMEPLVGSASPPTGPKCCVS
ncbi:hypothetical protein BaRGS_00024755, partial [Batillaria attramentaria]